MEPENIREPILDFTAHFGEINPDMPYLCRRGQSGPEKAVFAFFPLFGESRWKKTLNLRFFAKKQVNFWVVYLLSCKQLIINENMMMHRKMMIIVCHFTLCPLFSSVIRRANNLLEALKYKKTKKYQLWQYIQYINERYRLSIQKLYLKLNA